jgi:hypothetical protein
LDGTDTPFPIGEIPAGDYPEGYGEGEELGGEGANDPDDRGCGDGGGSVRIGTVTIETKPTPEELAYANKLAQSGYDVTVRGTGLEGADFIINGTEWEFKTLESGTANAVMQNIKIGIKQGDGRVIIDGGSAGVTPAIARQALARMEGGGSGGLRLAKEIIIETTQGQVHWP